MPCMESPTTLQHATKALRELARVKRSAELQLKTRLIGAANQADHELPDWLIRELRSNHAGEVGAVMIYRGILAVSKNSEVRAFALRHLETEQDHLRRITEVMPPNTETQLLGLWKLMGWLTGALPSFAGPHAVFATIEAVETFVDHHYQEQIVRLSEDGPFKGLRQLLVECQQDEVAHRDEAASLVEIKIGLLTRCWQWLVGFGSKGAVFIARKI